jgi:cell division protein FtsL
MLNALIVAICVIGFKYVLTLAYAFKQHRYIRELEAKVVDQQEQIDELAPEISYYQVLELAKAHANWIYDRPSKSDDFWPEDFNEEL